MDRPDDTLLSAAGFNTVATAPMVDIAGANSGQMGLVTDLRGINSNAAYMKQNTICIVLQTPRGFNFLPNPEEWHRMFKALFETGFLSFEGLNSGLTVEHSENAIGGSGEMQSDIANVTRERSQVTFTFLEKYGKPIQTALEGMVRYIYMDEESKVPLMMSLTDEPTDQLPDVTGFTMLFIEPCPLHKYVLDSWLITNMMISGNVGDHIGLRDKTQAHQTATYPVQFTGIQQVGRGINTMAQAKLDEMARIGINPNTRAAHFEALNADISGTAQGYTEVMNSAIANNVV